MVYVGIDVAKDKHDCYIVNSDGEVLAEVFTISNNLDGFNLLFQRIQSVAPDLSNIKVGLEATGHYSYNIFGFLLDKGLATCVINPLHTNLFRKSTSLRRTKTDRIDARTIAAMMMSGVVLTSYTSTSYHNEELKSLTRYRFEKVQERAKLKQSIARLVCILFPELETLVPTLHIQSVYALLAEFPGAKQIASCHLSHLKTLLSKASKGRYGREKAIELRNAAQRSIGSAMKMKSMELQHTIRLIRELDAEICEIEDAIRQIMDAMAPPILTIPGISYRMGAAYPHMEKRGSRYLRYALFNATRFVCNWDPSFAAYLAKKRSEGKHYNVAISHAAKKLVRIIFALMKSGKSYCLAT